MAHACRMDSAVGPVPHTATRLPAKQKPVRSKYATQPWPSVLKPMSASPFFTSTFAPWASFAVAAFAVAASNASGLYGVVMLMDRKPRASTNERASSSVAQSAKP